MKRDKKQQRWHVSGQNLLVKGDQKYATCRRTNNVSSDKDFNRLAQRYKLGHAPLEPFMLFTLTAGLLSHCHWLANR